MPMQCDLCPAVSVNAGTNGGGWLFTSCTVCPTVTHRDDREIIEERWEMYSRDAVCSSDYSITILTNIICVFKKKEKRVLR